MLFKFTPNGNFKKRKKIFTCCRKQKADFIFFQKNSLKKRQKRIGKMNGEVRLLWLIWQFQFMWSGNLC